MLVKNLSFETPILRFDIKNGLFDTIIANIDMGAITFKNGLNKFILDPVSTSFYPNDNIIEAVSKLEIDEDTFNEPNDYTLTVEELLSEGLTAEFYCNFDDPNIEIENITIEMTIGLIKLQINATLET